MSSAEARGQTAGATVPPTGGGQAMDQVRGAGGHDYRGAPGRRGRWLAAGVMIVVVAVAATVLVTRHPSTNPSPATGTAKGYRTATATVTRQSLTSQTEVDATLVDAGSWTVTVLEGSGSSASNSPGSGASSGSSGSSGPAAFTWLPRVGRTLSQGQVIYRVSGSPVVLLYGPVPAYRDLSEGTTGTDVTELNAALVKLGYATRAALGPRSGWDYYSAETAYAVEQLQAKLGLTVTGTLSLGEAVFLPGPALITGWGSAATVGGLATAGTVVLTASSTMPVVTIDLDAAQQDEVKAGDPVSITLPDNSTTPGVISQISRVASSSSGSTGSSGSPGDSSSDSSGGSGSSSATITVLAVLNHPNAAGKLNQAPVTVTITTGSAAGALTVPVDALLAEPGNEYAVEVTGPGGHHLVTVVPGLFDDAAGLVQVTGKLAPGQHVVVPAT